MFGFWFYGDDGEFEYFIGSHEYVEYCFRYPRLYGMTWTMDGDGWSSNETVFPENAMTGHYYIARIAE